MANETPVPSKWSVKNDEGNLCYRFGQLSIYPAVWGGKSCWVLRRDIGNETLWESSYKTVDEAKDAGEEYVRRNL